MAEIYVIRHGKTEMNKRNLIIGRDDSPLLVSSMETTERLAEKLKRFGLKKIYSSDLGRARHTAEIIAKKLGMEVILSPELREIDYGVLTGKPKEDMKKEYPLYHNNVNFVNPKGESFKQLYDRIVAFLNTLKNETEKILLITHAGCIRAIYSYYNTEDFQDNINIKLGHDKILKCVIEKEHMSAEFIDP